MPKRHRSSYARIILHDGNELIYDSPSTINNSHHQSYVKKKFRSLHHDGCGVGLFDLSRANNVSQQDHEGGDDDDDDDVTDVDSAELVNLGRSVILADGRTFFLPVEGHDLSSPPLHDRNGDGFEHVPVNETMLRQVDTLVYDPTHGSNGGSSGTSGNGGKRDAGHDFEDRPRSTVKRVRVTKDGSPRNRVNLTTKTKEWSDAWKEVLQDVTSGGHFRSLHLSHDTIARVSIAAAREARRIALANFRGRKEVSNRAKRLVVRMQQYWRKHEKEASDSKRRAAKAAEERRIQEEMEREALRQKKKLDFLLTQTELYSHFIGKKMGLLPMASEGGNEKTPPTTLTNVNQMSLSKEEQEERVRMQQDAERVTVERIRAQREAKAKFDAETEVMNLNSMATGTLSSRNGGGGGGGNEVVVEPLRSAEDIDLLNPSTMPETAHMESEPSIFMGKLKSYQLKGLNWLINLYEQGINGILADEMGLGKTIQTISFLSYLADVRNIWGPFLIVAPNSTLHQWEKEVRKFAPSLNVIPYWGSQKERAIIRKYWNPKLLYSKEAAFHVLVTSYQVAVNDEKHFSRLKWQYMVLDEAQALKNASSLRWASLLKLKCRNRLLLTGTPIQNSMAELWALLHFIMPEFFDSHAEFNEWFSRDIQGHASGDRESLDAHQLRRLHMILKPFMLRRVKKDVEHEMPAKVEFQVNCPLTGRQQRLYAQLKSRLTVGDDSQESLMNLIMQFRKVCNHPELFQRREPVFPVVFAETLASSDTSNSGAPSVRSGDFVGSTLSDKNPISVTYPRTLLDMVQPWWRQRDALASSRGKIVDNHLNIFHADYVHRESFGRGGCFSFTRLIDMSAAECAFLSRAAVCFKWMVTLVQQQHRHKQLLAYDVSSWLHADHNRNDGPSLVCRRFKFYGNVNVPHECSSPPMYPCAPVNTRAMLVVVPLCHQSLTSICSDDVLIVSESEHDAHDQAKSNVVVQQRDILDLDVTEITDPGKNLNEEEAHDVRLKFLNKSGGERVEHAKNSAAVKESVVHVLYGTSRGERRHMFEVDPVCVLRERSPLLDRVVVPLSTIVVRPLVLPSHVDWLYDAWSKSVLRGFNVRHGFMTSAIPWLLPGQHIPSSFCVAPAMTAPQRTHSRIERYFDENEDVGEPDVVSVRESNEVLPSWTPVAFDTMYNSRCGSWPSSVNCFPGFWECAPNTGSHTQLPEMGALLLDSGKLQMLDVLLARLKLQGHRTLIFSQMTKMMDILEDYMRYRHHKYFRLDGSTQLADRRDMVSEFQNDTSYFAFLLSTRAGGLGINLTGADTVVFYDNDWNPTVDAQAMDRVHRIGQTKQVRVFRLVCKDTVEERILKRAQYKFAIQRTVYAGGFKLQSQNDVEDVFGDDDEQKPKKKKAKTAKKTNAKNRKNTDDDVVGASSSDVSRLFKQNELRNMILS